MRAVTSRRIAALLAAAAGALTLATPAPATASALTIGDPIPPRASPGRTPVPGTLKVEAVRADPVGGPAWAFATYEADYDEDFPPGFVGECHVVGRLYAGRVGEVHAGGVFRPYALGAGTQSCGVSIADREPFMTSGASLPAIVPPGGCSPIAGGRLPVCDPANVRSMRFGLAGRGVVGGVSETAAGWRPMPVVPPRGAWLTAPVLGPDSPAARLFALACGPLARPDLATADGATTAGCVTTIPVPGPHEI